LTFPNGAENLIQDAWARWITLAYPGEG